MTEHGTIKIAEGPCLEPLLYDGERLVVETAPLQAFDMVCAEHKVPDGIYKMTKLFLGVSPLPDGGNALFFATLQPEQIIILREEIVTKMQRVSVIIDKDGTPRKPGTLPEDHWFRAAVRSQH